jgi:U3 small nucleolar RNA-associated protein 14
MQALSAEEQAARRDRLAKMRALLFYHERKAARMKAIKSKARAELMLCALGFCCMQPACIR